MKKLFIPFVFCCVFLLGCPQSPEDTQFSKIEYQAFGRAGAEYILLEKGTIKHVLRGKDTITNTLKEKDYKALYTVLKGINLSQLRSLDIPSKKHQFDGAKATTLSIITKDQIEYTSPTFDDTNPPREIKELVSLIKSLVKK